MAKTTNVGYNISTPLRRAQIETLRSRERWAARRNILIRLTVLVLLAAGILMLGAWMQSVQPIFPLTCPYGPAEDDCVPEHHDGHWYLNQRPDPR